MDTAGRHSFATRLKAHRLARGLTQERLAEQTGLSRDAISRLERGERRHPRRDTVTLLARALKLSGDERERLLALAAQQRGRATAASAEHPVSPTALPPRLTSLVGREREIAEVRAMLLDRRLLTLTGPGGIGKTSLVLAVASAVQEQFADGVALVDLAALTDGELVPHAVGAAVGVRERPGEPISVTLAIALEPTQRLLVLDNCEHLLLSCARLVEALLLACPHLWILATSREPLRIAAEVVWRVPALTLPHEDTQELAEVARSEAVRLFVERAVAIRSGFELTNGNVTAVAEICRRLDGIPLAIELAAARVAALTPAQIARHLDDRFRLLTQGSRTALPRQQTLRATLDWSYDLLTDTQRFLFNRIAVFAGGFDLEAAKWVGGDSPLAREVILDLLANLVDKSLVVAVAPTSGESRYHLLWTIREYGRERLAAAGEADSMAGRHAAHYLAYAEECSALEHSARQSEWLARLDLERDNLRQAVEWWMSRDLECALRLVSALGYGWWRRGPESELQRWIARLLPQRHALPRTVTLGRFLLQAGHSTDDAEPAARRTLFEESLAVSLGVGDRRGAADALWILARDALSIGDYPAARALHAECLADADAELRSRTLVDAGILARRTGDVAQSRMLSEEAVVNARQSGVPMTIGYALDHLGKLERIQGNLARAVALSEESLAVFREAGLENTVPWMLRALGRLARLQGDYARARILQGQTLAGAHEMLQRHLIVEAHHELGLIAAAEGDLAGAHRELDEALLIARDGMRWETAELFVSLGLVARAEGGLAEARHSFDESLTFWREVGNPHGVAIVTGNLGVVALQEGNLSLARDLFSQSLVVRRELGDQAGTATLLECFAGLASLGDDPAGAFQLLGAADRIRSAVGNPAPPIWQKQRDPWMEPARLSLHDRARVKAYVAGQTTGWEGIVPEVLRGGQRI